MRTLVALVPACVELTAPACRKRYHLRVASLLGQISFVLADVNRTGPINAFSSVHFFGY